MTLLVILALALFWVIVPLISVHYVFDIVNALSVAVGMGVISAYAPGLFRELLVERRKPTGAHMLVGGIVLAWAATVGRSLYMWWWRLFNGDLDFLESPVLAFVVYAVFVGGCMHLLAKGEPIEGRFPRKSWLTLGIVVAGGTALALFVIWFLEQPPPGGR